MSLSDYQCFSSQKLASPGGMNWRGTWGIPGIYQYGDVVEGPDGEGYVCIDLDGNVGSVPGAAPAVWQLLSNGSATAVSMTAANGSGITVAEPTPNNFTVATNLVAGTGIALTPSLVNTSVTVGLSAPVVLYDGIYTGAGAVTINSVAGAWTPAAGVATFPIVAGNYYEINIQGAIMSVTGGTPAILAISPDSGATQWVCISQDATVLGGGGSVIFRSPVNGTAEVGLISSNPASGPCSAVLTSAYYKAY